MPEIPEPGDRAIVAWFNGHGVPEAVHVRLDDYVYQDDDQLARWFNADEERGAQDGPERWNALCDRRRKFGDTGPYVLNVGELLGGTDGQ